MTAITQLGVKLFLYSNSGKLCTVQYINRQSDKRFEPDGQKKGAFYVIAGDDEKIIIAEGYSTAASIREATGDTAVVAFDAGNLLPPRALAPQSHSMFNRFVGWTIRLVLMVMPVGQT